MMKIRPASTRPSVCGAAPRVFGSRNHSTSIGAPSGRTRSAAAARTLESRPSAPTTRSARTSSGPSGATVVVEVHVDVTAGARPIADAFRVGAQHPLGVRAAVAPPRTVPAHVDEVRRERTGNGLVFPVVHTERDVRPPETLEDVVDQPR